MKLRFHAQLETQDRARSRRALLVLAIAMIAVFGVILPGSAHADSPLTSIDYAVTYSDHAEVVKAAEVGFDDEIAAALSSPEVSHDVRAAIINALGWTLGGQKHARQYLHYIAAQREKHPRDIQLESLTAQEAFSLGYLLAMDDYLDLEPIEDIEGPLASKTPRDILAVARQKAPGSFAVALVAGLVESQAAMQSNWCQVYRRTNDVVEGFDGDRDLRDEAVAQVMEYIELYESECTNPRPVKGP